VKPRYTDLHKYPNGYTPSHATDISERVRKHLRAVREQQKANAEEAKEKTVQLPRKAHG